MTDQQPHDNWDEFKSWHKTAALYREIYARTVATLLAAFVVYLIAAVAGLVSVQPLGVVGVPLLILGLGCLIFSVPGAYKHWHLVKPLYRVWNNDESPEMQLAKRLYMRLTIGEFSTFFGLVFIGVAIAKA